MRIIAGQLKTRIIRTPGGRVTRPTSNRLRESVFNILTHADWAPSFGHTRVLDLFAGSGALGLEALSRGAAFVLFVEKNHAACRTITRNGEAFGLCNRMQVIPRDATKLVHKPESADPPFDLAFIDAPYNGNCVTPCLQNLKQGAWMKNDGIAMVETAAGEKPDFTGLTVMLDRQSGASRIWFLKGFESQTTGG